MMAPKNKCLARSNKSPHRANATNEQRKQGPMIMKRLLLATAAMLAALAVPAMSAEIKPGDTVAVQTLDSMIECPDLETHRLFAQWIDTQSGTRIDSGLLSEWLEEHRCHRGIGGDLGPALRSLSEWLGVVYEVDPSGSRMLRLCMQSKVNYEVSLRMQGAPPFELRCDWTSVPRSRVTVRKGSAR
jgi:hypothetical protein